LKEKRSLYIKNGKRRVFVTALYEISLQSRDILVPKGNACGVSA
jgi:hypothetical protein